MATELRAFLASTRATTAAKEGQDLAEGRADPASIQALFALLRTNLDALAQEDIERQRTREKLDRELQLARAELGTLRPEPGARAHAVRVQVEARQAGALTIELAYVVRGAGWRPAYRASLDPATGEVALVAEAAVRQSAGEDWNGVALKLSTAAPARGVEPPALTSWLLRPWVATAVTSQAIGRVAGGVEGGRADGERNANSIEEMELQMKDEAAAFAPPAEYAQAAVVHSAYNVAFDVPGASDVPADGNEHRVVRARRRSRGRCATGRRPRSTRRRT